MPERRLKHLRRVVVDEDGWPRLRTGRGLDRCRCPWWHEMQAVAAVVSDDKAGRLREVTHWLTTSTGRRQRTRAMKPCWGNRWVLGDGSQSAGVWASYRAPASGRSMSESGEGVLNLGDGSLNLGEGVRKLGEGMSISRSSQSSLTTAASTPLVGGGHCATHSVTTLCISSFQPGNNPWVEAHLSAALIEKQWWPACEASSELGWTTTAERGPVTVRPCLGAVGGASAFPWWDVGGELTYNHLGHAI